MPKLAAALVGVLIAFTASPAHSQYQDAWSKHIHIDLLVLHEKLHERSARFSVFYAIATNVVMLKNSGKRSRARAETLSLSHPAMGLEWYKRYANYDRKLRRLSIGVWESNMTQTKYAAYGFKPGRPLINFKLLRALMKAPKATRDSWQRCLQP